MNTQAEDTAPLPPRIAAKIDATGDCWEWIAGTDERGYARVQMDAWRYAHRVVWTFLVGPVPAGLTLDHLCQNKPCVNPDHLEVVTKAENSRRAQHDRGASKRLRPHCAQGHPYQPGSYFRTKDGYRRCRACVEEWNRRRRIKRARTVG